MTPPKDDGNSIKSGMGVAAAAGTAALAAGAGPAVAAGVAVVPPLLDWAAGQLIRARSNAANKRVELWLENVAAALEFGGIEAAQRELEEHLDEAWAREGLLESFRHLMEMLSESVIPTLGRMSAAYMYEKRSPDVFFRSFGTLLRDIDTERFEHLKYFVSSLHADVRSVDPSIGENRTEGVRGDSLLIILSRREDRSHFMAVTDYRFPESDKRREREIPTIDRVGMIDLFSRLKRAVLGHDNVAGYIGSVSGHHAIVMKIESIQRMQAFV